MATLKLAVVDDEPGIRSGVLRILRGFKVDYPFMDEHFEFELFEAATGEEAKDLIESNPPDIILLDNKLPGIQGIEVLEYIKKKKLDIIVVMITSYASLELAVQATKDGAYDFIPKPFTPQELRSSIENITKRVFLKRMTKQLMSEGKQVRFQFLSVLSHELKAPINAVEGYLKMIYDREMGEDLKNYDQFIDRALKRIDGMRNLILDLLDLTKIQSGKKQKVMEKIELDKLLNSAIDVMQPYAIQRNVEIKHSKHGNCTIEADPDDIEIVLNNLISNAVKYNRKEGKVEITLEETEDLVIFMVEDSGIGISKEDQAKIFKDFVRIKNEKTKHISGSGLGLSIVKNIVETYDGEIELESEPENGSTFIVKFPLCK